MDGTLGEIRIFAGNYAPQNWALCQGQLLSISQFNVLYSILGLTYGGDGRTNFALPDFRGRLSASTGSNTGGLPEIELGEMDGEETSAMLNSQMPYHSHAFNTNSNTTGRNLLKSPTSNYFAQNQNSSGNFSSTAGSQMNLLTVSPVGSGVEFNNLQPYLGINFIICIEGNYPVRP